jgi:hypothetical protein
MRWDMEYRRWDMDIGLELGIGIGLWQMGWNNGI